MNTDIKNRLEYIDALRGFIMLIIVYWHINYFSFDILKVINKINSFENIFLLFGMPLFFFISGVFAYKEKQIWDWQNSIKYIGSKFKQLIIPTLFILGLFIYVFNLSLKGCFYSPMKYGYWFTISLFEYFVLYVLIAKLLNKIKHSWKYDISLLIIGLFIFIATISPQKVLSLIGISDTLPNALGYSNFQYFIYFVLGAIVKRRYDLFKRFIDNSILMGLTIALFFIIALMYIKTGPIYGPAINESLTILLGITGCFVSFSFFYKYQDCFTKEKRVGRILQYIGRRTLDIYLLHYFFLPRNLKMVGEWFTVNINPTIEFFVSIALAAMVIALCLITSSIIRISPLLANWLFGVKNKSC